MLPVNKLPDEILLRAFNYITPMGEFYGDFDRRSEQILAFSQVCHAWRTVALSAPQLWMAPMLERPCSDMSMQILARSQKMPLIIKGSMEAFPQSLLEHVFEQGLPIQELYLRGSALALSILEDLSYAPLHLSTLVLTCRGVHHFEDLFRGPTPQLQMMRLYDCTVHWTSPIYTSLVHLKMDMSETLREQKMRLSEILATLEHTPALRRAYFGNIINHASLSEEISLPGGPIRLDRLDRLIVHDDVPAAIVMLQHLSVSHSALIKLSTCGELDVMEPTKHGVDIAMDYLASRVTHGPSLEAVDFDADEHARLAASMTDGPRDRFQFDAVLQDLYNEDYDQNSPTPAHMLQSAVERLPMRELRSFSLQNMYGNQPEDNYQITDICAAFRKAINLRSLRLSYVAVMPGLQAMLRFCDDSPTGLSHLTDITLRGVDVTDAIGDNTSPRASELRVVSVLDYLVEALAGYHTTGRLLQRLMLRNCTLEKRSNPHKLAKLIKERCGSYVVHITVSSGPEDEERVFDEHNWWE